MHLSNWRASSLRWAYLFVAIPAATDWMERGEFPAAPRGWISEIAMAALIAVGVRALCRQADRLAALSCTDGLTGLPNRRSFDEDLARLVASGRPLTLACLDVDNFKYVNDTQGHAAGDDMLRHIANALQRELRGRSDRAYRLGGDEFAVLMSGTEAPQAAEAIERIHRQACAAPEGLSARGAGLSVGVVQLERGESLEAFYRRADEAMYAIKKRGETRATRRTAEPKPA